MKNIALREAYDWLFCDDEDPEALTNLEWQHLLTFMEQKYSNENVIEYANNRVRFINLVGVIQLNTARIEILPKVTLNDTNEGADRRALLTMLSKTKKLPVEIADKTLSSYEKADLVHILANLYVVELINTLNRGIYREYRLTEENIPTLKGRLLISDHLRKNAFGSVKAYCEFDELTPDILVNQLLKAALRVVFPYVRDSALKIKLMNGLEMLDEVSDIIFTSGLPDQVELNRQNKHYGTAMQLALAILQSTLMNSGQNSKIAFSYLFKMNDLFESYIGVLLNRLMIGTDRQVWSQHTAKRLLQNISSGRENILLKPDFVIESENGIPEMIIDTKWKNIMINARLNYKQADIYQMYAYITAYKEAQRCILLYPRTEDEELPVWRVPDYIPEKYIEVKTVRLDTVRNTVTDLSEMMESFVKNENVE